MPELEPITREETLLDGGDLTPITRKEMFIKRIYDKTQTIPEPITREEYFLKKAGEGSGDVTVEQLNVTQNGTYSESGKAYSPVVVNVPAPPIPDNAYLLNEVEGLPKDIVTFSDGSNLPMPSLKTTIVPIQSGSGDPSPTNIRPISGHTEANIVVSPTTDAEDGHTYTIPFTDSQGNPITVYGGTLDVVSGVLTVDRGYVDLGTLNYTYYSGNLFVASISNLKPIPNAELCNALCSIYVAERGNEYASIDGSFVAGFNNAPNLAIHDSRFADATAFKQAMNGVQLVYELATPITIQLTPTQVKSLLGQNNIWADTGEVLEAEYFTKGD